MTFANHVKTSGRQLRRLKCHTLNFVRAPTLTTYSVCLMASPRVYRLSIVTISTCFPRLLEMSVLIKVLKKYRIYSHNRVILNSSVYLNCRTIHKTLKILKYDKRRKKTQKHYCRKS